MKSFRKYGEGPYSAAVVHGGPGAPGDVAQVARVLSEDVGVIEPLLSAESINGQVDELRYTLKKYGDVPVDLVGHSWGAWLSLIFTALYPGYVKKLILVGSGPFEDKYVSQIMKTRLNRLDEHEKGLFLKTIERLNEKTSDKNNSMKDLEKMISKTDSYDLIGLPDDVIEFQPKVYEDVWHEAEKLRESGELLEYVEKIDRPVTAIHGDYDPHPFEGVEEPLAARLDDFKFILLDQCGHYPWYEKYAEEEFFKILRNEIGP